MAVARIQGVNGSGISTTLNMTGVLAGSLLVVEARVGALGATVTVADDLNGSWTLAVSQAQATDGHTDYVFFFPASDAGSLTITLSTSGGSVRFNASEWSGADPSPLGFTSSAQGSPSPISSGSITAVVGDLVFGAMTNDRTIGSDWVAGGTSAGGSWAMNCDYNEANHAVASEYVIATASGSFAATPTDDNVGGDFLHVTSMVVQFKANPLAFDKVVGTANNTFAPVALTVASGGVAAGNLCVAAFFTEVANDTLTSVTDPRANVWTIEASFPNNVAGAPFTTAVAWCVLTTALQAGDVLTFNATNTTADKLVTCVAYAGVSSSPRDQYSTNQDASFPQTTFFDSGGVTTTQADEVFVGLNIGRGPSNSFSPTGSWNARSTYGPVTAGNGATIYIEDRIVTAVEFDGTSPTATNACYWNSHVITFKAGAGTIVATVINGTQAQLVNVNAGGDDVDAMSYKSSLTLAEAEAIVLASTPGVLVTGDVTAQQMRLIPKRIVRFESS